MARALILWPLLAWGKAQRAPVETCALNSRRTGCRTEPQSNRLGMAKQLPRRCNASNFFNFSSWLFISSSNRRKPVYGAGFVAFGGVFGELAAGGGTASVDAAADLPAHLAAKSDAAHWPGFRAAHGGTVGRDGNCQVCGDCLTPVKGNPETGAACAAALTVRHPIPQSPLVTLRTIASL